MYWWRSVSHSESAIGDREEKYGHEKSRGKVRMMKGRMVNGRQKRAYVMAQEAVVGKISLNR